MSNKFCLNPDMERTAELFNNGYREAMQHKTGGAEHRAWLVGVAEEIIHEWVDTAYKTVLAGLGNIDKEARLTVKEMRHLHLAEPWLPACRIADAILSEINFEESNDIN